MATMALWGSLASQSNLTCETHLRQRETLSQKNKVGAREMAE